VVDNVVYTRTYRPFGYHGLAMERYVTPVYYPAPYYVWAYRPWPAPVPYYWGYRADPWYGYYSGYFTPLPVYPSPTLWLADFLIAESLRAAYLSSMAPPATPGAVAPAEPPPPPAPAPAATLTPEVREAIAQEVQRQLAEERARAAQPAAPEVADSGPPPVLAQPNRVLVVSTPLDVLASGQECQLSSGDVLQVEGAPPDGTMAATVRVLSAKPGDCAAGSEATLSAADLQEMYNSFSAQVDTGLARLDQQQGRGSIPPAPPDALQPAQPAPGVADLPPPDGNVAALLQEQQAGADQAEAEVLREAELGGT
jgi:hypothetical protein